MNSAVRNSITLAEAQSQYDAHAKRLLANKSILANILVHTVDDFRGMKPSEAETCIEGEPMISKVPVDPGFTNQSVLRNSDSGHRIRGFNTEDSEINEDLIRFDIVFYIRTANGLAQIIINIEIQKDEPGGYDLLNRATYYECRLISSQKGRDFIKSRYNDIRQVYSIWICMGMKECVWDHIHLTDDKLLGTHQWKGRLDLFNIVMIGLPDDLPEKEERHELHRLLTALLSMHLTAEEKVRVLSEEYTIPMQDEIEKEMESMCNLGQGVYERGEMNGEIKGEIKKVVEQICKKMQKNKSYEVIAEELEEDSELMRQIYETALLFAPEYDPAKVCSQVMEKQKL